LLSSAVHDRLPAGNAKGTHIMYALCVVSQHYLLARRQY